MFDPFGIQNMPLVFFSKKKKKKKEYASSGFTNLLSLMAPMAIMIAKSCIILPTYSHTHTQLYTKQKMIHI